MYNQPTEFRMRSAMFLLIFLTGVHCMAQNNRLTIKHSNSSVRSTLIYSNRSGNKGPIQNRSIYSIKEKIPVAGLHPKQKSGTQLIDSVYMWRWDSIIADWALDYKYSAVQYDANNNALYELGQTWDGSSWVYADQGFCTYDERNNPLVVVWQIWTGTVWENDQKDSCAYDAGNNVLTELLAYWDGSSWENSMLIKNTWDANSNKTSYLHQNWNGTDWENYWQEFYTYDDKNNMTGETHQVWDGDQWVDEGRNTYVYDNNNNLVSSVTQVDNDAELVTTEITYFYDAGNKLVIDSTRSWGATWEDKYLGTYTYDSHGNLISWLSQIKNGDQLENINRIIFTYDATNNRTSAFRQDWKDNSWVNLDFERNLYDENNLLINESYKYWNSSGTKVMDGDSSVYYYKDAVTGINEIEGTKEYTCIYPNPNNGKFTLTSNGVIQSVVIFDMNGKVICTDSGFIQQMQKEIDLSNYGKGVYLIKIQTSTGIEAKKVLIR